MIGAFKENRFRWVWQWRGGTLPARRLPAAAASWFEFGTRCAPPPLRQAAESGPPPPPCRCDGAQIPAGAEASQL